VTNAFKEWWTQAEAAVGFANAFQLSGTPAYLDASLKTWDYIEQHLIDKTHGEWFIGRSGDGTVPAPVKISFWKCPYHNGRACLELIHRLRAIADDH
jgi:cellobiose epimerase